MLINKTRQTQNTGHRNRSYSPIAGARALVVQEKSDQPQRSGTSGSAPNPNRRGSAFLAHLSLQYDGVKEQRQMRSERLKSAIQSYGLEAAARSVPYASPLRNLSI